MNYETIAESKPHLGWTELTTSYPGCGIAVVARLMPAVEEKRSPHGKLLQSGVPFRANCIMSLPLQLETTDPWELRANALTLLDAADALEANQLSGGALTDDAKATA